MLWLALAVGTILAGLLIAYGFASIKRARLYQSLRSKLARSLLHPPVAKWDLPRAVPLGAHFATVPDFLPEPLFQHLLDELSAVQAVERGYIPLKRKAGTIAYETLIETSPTFVTLYHSSELLAFLSGCTGVHLVPTPIRDQSSLSLLIYDKPGDYIGWHYDHNFYKGRHFTVILCLVNQGSAVDGLSHASFAMIKDGQEQYISAAPNTLIMFEGNKVYHRVTPIEENERRVVMSMTFCTEPSSSWPQAVSRRIKDTAFFGLRALWT
jgi:hypothetical protein